MKALILAAGLGTRLRPLTDTMPKALVEWKGKTLLEHSIEHLKNHGIREIIINVHHFPDQILDFLKRHQNFGMEIAISDERELLLDTGGGVNKAGWFFAGDGPFVVRNVDIISDIDLKEMTRVHKSSGALATLAIRKRETSRYLIFDEGNLLCGWKNLSTNQTILRRESDRSLQDYAFSGIQIMNPEIFTRISEKGKFTLIDLYLRLCETERILGYPEMDSIWMDAGKPLL